MRILQPDPFAALAADESREPRIASRLAGAGFILTTAVYAASHAFDIAPASVFVAGFVGVILASIAVAKKRLVGGAIALAPSAVCIFHGYATLSSVIHTPLYLILLPLVSVAVAFHALGLAMRRRTRAARIAVVSALLLFACGILMRL